MCLPLERQTLLDTSIVFPSSFFKKELQRNFSCSNPLEQKRQKTTGVEAYCQRCDLLKRGQKGKKKAYVLGNNDVISIHNILFKK